MEKLLQELYTTSPELLIKEYNHDIIFLSGEIEKCQSLIDKHIGGNITKLEPEIAEYKETI